MPEKVSDSKDVLTLPRFNLKDRQLYDLEMLMVGGFLPLTGFMNEADYQRVVGEMRMEDGTLFPIPVVLDIPDSSEFQAGDSVLRCDPYGNPMAVMGIESHYRPNKKKEVQSVYGTEDMLHPGVRYVMNQMHDTYIGGKITAIKVPDRYDFREHRYTPKELKAVFKEKGWNPISAVSC